MGIRIKNRPDHYPQLNTHPEQEEKTHDASLPNSFIMRMSEIPAAEEEADKLSAGIMSGTPNSVRTEMGKRLHADFSSVRFHSDPASARQSDAMGARAWTRGHDIYFGSGGFDPAVGAHELVHTVQQGAVSGSAGQSVPSGAVQLWPWSKKRRRRSIITAPQERDSGGSLLLQDADPQEQNLDITDKIDWLIKTAAGFAASGPRKNLVSSYDNSAYSHVIRNLNKDEFLEIMRRKKISAENLADQYKKSGDRSSVSMPGKNGENYSLTLLDRIQADISSDNPNYQSWNREYEQEEADREAKDPKAYEKINTGFQIHMMAKTVSSRPGADKESEISFYKDLYQGNIKRERLEVLAEKYARASNLLKYGGTNDSSEEIPAVDGMEGIKDDSSENLIIDNMSKLSAQENNSTGAEQKPSGLNEENKPDISHISGMPEKDIDNISAGEGNINILQEIGRSSGKGENDILSEIIKPAGKSANNILQENNKSAGQIENNVNANQIIRQENHIDDAILQDFESGNANIKNTKKLNTKAEVVRNFGMLANNATQIGMLSINHEQTAADNIYSNEINPIVGGAADVMAMGSGLTGLVTGVHDTWKNYKNIQAGGRRGDVAGAVLDTATSGTTAAAGVLKVMQRSADLPVVGDALGKAGNFGGANMIPGLNIATGAGTALSGGIQTFRGQRSVNKINKQISQLERRKGKSDEQRKLLSIFRHGKRVAEKKRTGGIMKTLGGGLTLGTGIAALSGPLAPITAAGLAIAGIVTGLTKFFYDRKKKKNLRHDVVAEEMGIDWNTEMARVRRMFPEEKLKDKDVRAIILKGHGYAKGTRKDAFSEIKKKRAKFLLDTYKKGGVNGIMARKVISALGVHRKGGRYAKGALRLLADKLG